MQVCFRKTNCYFSALDPPALFILFEHFLSNLEQEATAPEASRLSFLSKLNACNFR